MTNLCAEMRMQVVAEGIETPEERDCILELRCDLHAGLPLRQTRSPVPGDHAMSAIA